jgi:hypothetical protein
MSRSLVHGSLSLILGFGLLAFHAFASLSYAQERAQQEPIENPFEEESAATPAKANHPDEDPFAAEPAAVPARANQGSEDNPFGTDPAATPSKTLPNAASPPEGSDLGSFFGKQRSSIAARLLEGVLDRATTIEVAETPLRDVLAEIQRAHGNIPIVLDARAMEDAAIDSELAITQNLKSIPLRKALQMMLDPIEMTYVVDGHVVFVTTNEVAAKKMIVQVYHAADYRQLAESPKEVEELASLLQSTALSGSPANPTGEASVQAFRQLLIVRAPYHGHRAIRELLDEMRMGMSQQVTAKQRVN